MNDAAKDDDLSDEVLRAIRRILRRTSEHSRQLTRVAGLSVAGLMCLKAIDAAKPDAANPDAAKPDAMEPDGEVTVVGVSRAVHLAPATVSRILDRLETSQLIERRPSRHDRRRVCLVLTDNGRQKLRELPEPLQEHFVDQLRNLLPETQQQIRDTLQLVVRMMEADTLDAAPILTPEPDFKSSDD